MNAEEIAKNLFSGTTKDDIVCFMINNYARINGQDTRADLGNRSVASNFSDLNWKSLEQYAKDKKLGKYIEVSGKKRWSVDNLYFNIKKVDKNLKPSSLDIDDSAQLHLALDIPVVETSIDHPLLIGYIPDVLRTSILEIHIIKYKTDGSVDWSFPMYKHNEVTEDETKQERKDIKRILKVKMPQSNVIGLFDKDENKDK